MYEVIVKNAKTGVIENMFTTSLATMFVSVDTDDGRSGVACLNVGHGDLEEITKHFLGLFNGLKALRDEDQVIRLAMEFVNDHADDFVIKTEKMN